MSIFTKKQLGFTLMEILVVMAIIGILASIGMGAYGTAQSKARDARRKSDLENIARALEMYYNDNKGYPPVSGAGSFSWGSRWAAGTTIYMEKVPTDTKYGYLYEHYGSEKGYILYARLENVEDAQAARTSTGAPGKYELKFCGTVWVDGCNYLRMSTNAIAPPIIDL